MVTDRNGGDDERMVYRAHALVVEVGLSDDSNRGRWAENELW